MDKRSSLYAVTRHLMSLMYVRISFVHLHISCGLIKIQCIILCLRRIITRIIIRFWLEIPLNNPITVIKINVSR